MPRIPVTTQQVATAALPTPYDRGDVTDYASRTAGALLGQGAKALEGMTEDVAKAQDEARTVSLLKAGLEDDQARDRILTSFSQLLGENAMAGRDAALADLDAWRTKVRDSLADDRIKQAFDLRSAAGHMAARRTIEGHVAGQVDQVKDATEVASVEEKVRLLGNAWNDDRTSALERAQLDQVLAVRAQRKGMLPEAAAKLRRGAHAQAAIGGLDAAIGAQDGERASQLLERSKEDLSPKTVAVYQERIAELGRATTIERGAARIMAAARDDEGHPLVVNGAWALAAVDELPDATPAQAEVKAGIRTQVEHRLGVARRQLDEAAGQHLQALLAGADKLGPGALSDPALSADRSWLQDKVNGHVDDWLRFKGDLERQARARWDKASDDALEQRKLNAEALRLYRSLPLEDRAGQAIGPEYSFADADTRKALATLQAEDKRFLDGGGAMKEEEVRKAAAAELGDLPRKLPKAQVKVFDAKVTAWYSNWRKEHEGKDPTRKDLKTAVADMLTPGEVEGTFYDPDVYKFQVKPGQKWIPQEGAPSPARARPRPGEPGGAPLLTPSAAERAKIEAALTRAGRPVTAAAVQTLWLKAGRP